MPEPTLEETLERVRAALRHAAPRRHDDPGHDGERTELRAYQALRAAGELTARISSIQNHRIDGSAAGVMTGFGDDWLRVGGIKFFSDGSMGSATAAFFEPYCG